MSAPPRVVVAEDSAFMRRLLADALHKHGCEIVASVEDGDQALAACVEHRPDVLSLDLAMPGLDGIGVLRALDRTDLGAAVVVVSAFSPTHGARALDALAEGAVDLVAKPAAGESLGDFFSDLGSKVRLAAGAEARRSHARRNGHAASPHPRSASGGPGARPLRPRSVVIACSTGGPQALNRLLPKLGPLLGAGTLLVQHMPPGFTTSLAARLDKASSLRVREAQPGDQLEPATVLIAPGGRHLRIGEDGRTRLDDREPIGGLRPRADLTIADAAAAFGSDLLLVVLTGMGKDGLEGAREVHRRGGRILVEAESSCTVYGMPRAIVEAGLADGVHDLVQLPEAIAREAAP